VTPHGPYDNTPKGFLDEPARRELLDQVLAGVELGAWDLRVLDWLVAGDTPTVMVMAGLIERARQAERRRMPKPLKGAELTSFLTLLAAIRDALDAGYPDLAAMILHLLLEHRGALGLRSRNYTKVLREQMAERQPPKPGEGVTPNDPA
jgi:hypothetical protein